MHTVFPAKGSVLRLFQGGISVYSRAAVSFLHLSAKPGNFSYTPGLNSRLPIKEHVGYLRGVKSSFHHARIRRQDYSRSRPCPGCVFRAGLMTARRKLAERGELLRKARVYVCKPVQGLMQHSFSFNEERSC